MELSTRFRPYGTDEERHTICCPFGVAQTAERSVITPSPKAAPLPATKLIGRVVSKIRKGQSAERKNDCPMTSHFSTLRENDYSSTSHWAVILLLAIIAFPNVPMYEPCMAPYREIHNETRVVLIVVVMQLT